MPFLSREVAAIEDSGGQVPEGTHVVTCIAGVETQQQKGEVWEMQYKCSAGIIKDKLRWYGGAMGRSKKAVEAFFPGYQQQEQVGAKDLEGRSAEVDVVHREFTSDRDGKQHKVAEIEFGYRALTPAKQQAAQDSGGGTAAVRSLFGGGGVGGGS